MKRSKLSHETPAGSRSSTVHNVCVSLHLGSGNFEWNEEVNHV